MGDEWYSVQKDYTGDECLFTLMKETLTGIEECNSSRFIKANDYIEILFTDGNKEKHHVFIDKGLPKIFILYNRTYLPIAISDLPISILIRFL